MFKCHSIRFFLIFIFLFIAGNKNLIAQPILPDIAVVSENGINILTWNCQYDRLKSIAVQRSNDSNFNYTTIGYVRDIKKGVQYYLDGHPVPGNNWYRVTLVFGSNLAWTSNRIKIHVDSAQIVKGRVLPPNDSLQKFISKFRTKTVSIDTGTSTQTAGKKDSTIVVTNATTNKTSIKSMIDSVAKPVVKSIVIPTMEIPDLSEVNTYSYIKSQYVFTNPFTGHVNVEVNDALKHKYSIEFFDQDNIKILEVPRINEPHIIIDKRNFQRTGLYKFELTKDKDKLEMGYITIY